MVGKLYLGSILFQEYFIVENNGTGKWYNVYHSGTSEYGVKNPDIINGSLTFTFVQVKINTDYINMTLVAVNSQQKSDCGVDCRLGTFDEESEPSPFPQGWENSPNCGCTF